MIKREMQKRILTPRNSSLTFFYFRFLEIPGCKESQFYSVPFGQAVASMY